MYIYILEKTTFATTNTLSERSLVTFLPFVEENFKKKKRQTDIFLSASFAENQGDCNLRD